MKTKFLITVTAIMMAISFGANAQAPEKFNYQGIARNNNGAALSNQALGLKISILSPSNTAIYVEEHSVTTNDYGLYNVIIGEGTAVTGSMGGINWAGGTKKIKVEIDPNGGTSYTSLGTTELLSVPYALYAAGSEGWSMNGNNAGNNDFIGTNNNQDLRFEVNGVESGVISSGAPRNTALGFHALEANTAGDDNSAFGHNALKANTDGLNNTALGAYAMEGNLSGDNNVAVGNAALIANTQGDFNTALGNAALGANTTGGNNTAVGSTALDANTTGGLNVAVGVNALGANEEGNENTAIGTSAMADNISADYNVAVGRHALKSLAAGDKNTSVGYRSLYSSTLAFKNTAVGAEALEANLSGYENVAMGNLALSANTSGYRNVAIGTQALETTTIRWNNVAIGYKAMGPVVYPAATYQPVNNNVAIGANTEIGGSNNIAIGSNAAADMDNAIAIGYGTDTIGDEVTIGNPSSTNYYCYGNWMALSDIRFKTDVRPQSHGLDFILKLDPIMYHYDVDKQNEFIHGKERAEEIFPQEEWADNIARKESIWYSGFSAQQVAQAAEEIGYDFSGVHIPENEKEMYSLAYSEFVVPLVKAVQEQQELIKKLQEKVAALEKRMED